ncbi:MAG: hypothetical protein RIS29_726 [Bacteroidota bacterium]|jgi:hypothetical protein
MGFAKKYYKPALFCDQTVHGLYLCSEIKMKK